MQLLPGASGGIGRPHLIPFPQHFQCLVSGLNSDRRRSQSRMTDNRAASHITNNSLISSSFRARPLGCALPRTSRTALIYVTHDVHQFEHPPPFQGREVGVHCPVCIAQHLDEGQRMAMPQRRPVAVRQGVDNEPAGDNVQKKSHGLTTSDTCYAQPLGSVTCQC